MTSLFFGRTAFPACVRLALIAVLFTVAGASARAGQLDDIERRGVLRLGICSEEYPPFTFKGEKGWEGYDLELAHSLATDLNVSLDIVACPDWDGVIDLVRDGRADIGMSSLRISSSRARKVAFSMPYMRLRQGVLANQIALLKIPGEKNLDKIRSSAASIAVRQNSAYGAFARKFLPDAKIVELPAYDDCYALARSGEVTGAIGDEVQLLRWLGKVKGDSMRLTPIVFEGRETPIGIAAPAEDARFLSYLNSFIEVNRYPGTAQDLYRQYQPGNAGESSGGLKPVGRGEYFFLILAGVSALAIIGYFLARSGGKQAK